MRATASASFLLINNFVGLGLGPTLIGWLSEMFKARFGSEALRYAGGSAPRPVASPSPLGSNVTGTLLIGG